MLGKKLWIAGKTLFKNQILPNLKVAAKNGLKSSKQLIEDYKKEIGKVISDQSKNLQSYLLLVFAGNFSFSFCKNNFALFLCVDDLRC